MDQQTGKPEPGLTPHEAITSLVDQLKIEAQKVLTNDAQNLQVIKDLNFQLEILKSAYNEAKNEAKQLKADADKLNGCPRHVICLLDGDGAIFLPDIIAQGKDGGLRAASMLREAIHEKLLSLGPFQLWVYVFYNHGGLAATMGNSGHPEAKRCFHEFVYGFNRASERFIMVDVGYDKEAADAKIKAHLEDDIRMHQVSKIVFAGCHDTGYATTLNSLITHGFGDKLLLLLGYADMAPGIKALRLPSMTIPHLFQPEKFVPAPDTNVQVNNPRRTSSAHLRDTFLTSAAERQRHQDLSNITAVQGASVAPTTPPSPLDYKMALQSTPPPPSARSCSPVKPPIKHVLDPTKPLSKQTPAPCTHFYLAKCKWGEDCQYSHHYDLQMDHIAELRVNAKKGPCPFRNKDEPCPYGSDCVHGHMCPSGPRCYYAKLGSCKFAGYGMHSGTENN